jgi:hypothetical protein
MADQSNPLEGLTADEADAAIDRLAAKVGDLKESAKAAEEHLKAMKAARKQHAEPVPLDQRGTWGVEAAAQPAELTVEGGGN